MNQRIRVNAPHLILITVTVATALLAWLSLWLVLAPPWLGLELAAKHEGVVVTNIFAGGPAENRLEIGDSVTFLHSASGDVIPLAASTVMEEPDMLPDYARYNAFMAEQGRLFRALHSGGVMLDTPRGMIEIIPAARPLWSLPVSFWFQLLCGCIATLTGLSVLAFRPGQAATRSYALTGVSFMLITFTAAIYSSRELALDGPLFRHLSVLNHLGAMLFAGAFVSLLWLYPARLGRLWLAYLLVGGGLLVWLFDTLQWLPGTDWGIRAPTIFGLCLSVVFAIRQWRLSRQQPLERAALKWFLFSLYLGGATFVIAIFVTVWLGLPAPLSQGYAFGVVTAMYLGVAVGITRYRLFNLERWWFQVWLWFFAGVAIITADMLFVYALQLTQPLALGMALALAGWIYFPARQWLFNQLMPGGRRRLEQMFPQLLRIGLVATTPEALRQDWLRLLQEAFEPLQMTQADEPVDQVQLLHDGLALDLPGIGEQHSLRLAYPFGGRRLFSSEDLHLAQGLWQLAQRAVHDRNTYENGIQVERERIARDLHDDIGSRLLTLTHRATDPAIAELARDALRDLRSVVVNLGVERRPLEEAVNDWHAEAEERCAAAGVALDWQEQGVENDDHWFTAQQRLNLQRVFREAISNALRHSGTARIELRVTVADETLSISVCDNGTGDNAGQWRLGRGLVNMQRRMEALSGGLAIHAEAGKGVTVAATLPLSREGTGTALEQIGGITDEQG